MKPQAQNTTSRRFAEGLLSWNRDENRRQMPWKGEKDPYRIWLSEVILQQTRVEQGLKYYQNFISAYPTVQDLAAAPAAEVIKLWEGLGYYSRCRNLMEAARAIAFEQGGVFPQTYEAILALKGVGPYTAAAIASFAYNAPHAVLDGNVFRVLSRIHADPTPIDSVQGKKRFNELAKEALPQGKAGEYNQAIMDFGATICKPAPLCDSCFFRGHCKAFREGIQRELPVKEKKTKLRSRWMNYFILLSGDGVAVAQRREKDIWQDLHEFLLVETAGPVPERDLLSLFEEQTGMTEYEHRATSPEIRQLLSHQTVYLRFLHVELKMRTDIENLQWVERSELGLLAFPKTLKSYTEAHLSRF